MTEAQRKALKETLRRLNHAYSMLINAGQDECAIEAAKAIDEVRNALEGV